MKATIFDLGGGIGVCHFRRDNLTYVAEVAMDEKRVLPQSVREVRAILQQEVEVEDEATAKDHIKRAALGIQRFRDRLEMVSVDAVFGEDVKELLEQVLAAETDLLRLRLAIKERA